MKAMDNADESQDASLSGIARELGRKPRILIYTSLFPNSEQPQHGNFVLERMRYLIPFMDMSVMSPVPYFPRATVNSHWSVFARIPRRELFADFEVDHPRYLVFPKVGMFTHGVSMLVGSLPCVRDRFKATDFDLIDAHYLYPDGLAATMLGALFKKPVVVSARGSDVNLFSKFKTIRPMLRHVLKEASRVVAVTQPLKNLMVELGCPSEKITVVSNGVDAVKFTPQERTEVRQKLGLPAGCPIVLSVGHLSENKGFHILIEAVARLRERRPDVMLVIVGDGSYRRHLQSKIRDLKVENVRLVGAVPHGELAAWYSAADVFCLASLLEGCPNVILEAMACGCPIVATPAGGVPGMVNSPALGILADRSADALEAALDRALSQEWDRPTIVGHAQTQSWAKVTTQLLSLYSEVLAKKKEPAWTRVRR
jgi:teichuronic acid biosynthesis glycosyltransferase TuaC